MTAALSNSSVYNSLANRTIVPVSTTRNKSSQMKYFNNLEAKLSTKSTMTVKNSFEFSFDDMF